MNSNSWLEKKIISFNQWNQIVRNAIQTIVENIEENDFNESDQSDFINKRNGECIDYFCSSL